jgi:hypothetical protein
MVSAAAAAALLRQSSESLAGRIAFHDLPGVALREVGAAHANRLWGRGGFPRAYLSRSDPAARPEAVVAI